MFNQGHEKVTIYNKDQEPGIGMCQTRSWLPVSTRAETLDKPGLWRDLPSDLFDDKCLALLICPISVQQLSAITLICLTDTTYNIPSVQGAHRYSFYGARGAGALEEV